MKNEKEIFEVQSKLLKEAVGLVTARIERFEPTQEEKPKISDAEAAIRIFRIRSLRLYRDTLNFLADEVSKDDPRHAYFLLPHIRTLLDIYARFLHLLVNCSDDNTRALTCIAYQLYTYKGLGEEAYASGISIYKKFLAEVKSDFPHNPADLKWRGWIEKNKIAFADKSKLLTTQNIHRYSTDSLELFKGEKTYVIYSHLSELMHGNPYYYDEEPRNERFWVVSMAIINTAFLVELIDRHILDRGLARDFREWLASVKNSRQEFIEFWQKNSRLRSR